MASGVVIYVDPKTNEVWCVIVYEYFGKGYMWNIMSETPKEKKGELKWNVPGNKGKPVESSFEAMIRGFREELKVNPEEAEKILLKDSNGDYYTTTINGSDIFIAVVTDGEAFLKTQGKLVEEAYHNINLPEDEREIKSIKSIGLDEINFSNESLSKYLRVISKKLVDWINYVVKQEGLVRSVSSFSSSRKHTYVCPGKSLMNLPKAPSLSLPCPASSNSNLKTKSWSNVVKGETPSPVLPSSLPTLLPSYSYSYSYSNSSSSSFSSWKDAPSTKNPFDSSAWDKYGKNKKKWTNNKSKGF